jgi:pimeloyl-ACP methyl ester carboxylesterase
MALNRFRFKLLRIGIILTLAAVATYALLVVGASQAYVWALTHPACVRSETTPPGFQPVELTNENGATLLGWFKPPERDNAAAVVLLGGQGASRDAMLPEAEMLARHGYGVLSIDYRTCAGQTGTLGYAEVGDLRTGVAFLKSWPGVAHVGVLGFSVGGITAIRGAARIPEIEAVVAMGGYSNLADQVLEEPAGAFSAQWLAQRLVLALFQLQTGVAPGQISPITDLPTIAPRPVLLIFGEYEIARAQGQAQFDAARSPKALWVVPGVGHGGYYQARPAEFEQRVTAFFGQMGP